MLFVHFTLLAVVALVTVVLVVRFGGLPRRSLTSLIRVLLPLTLLGGICALLLSGAGSPIYEWLLPAACVAVLWAFCRSDRAFNVASPLILAAAVILCINFMGLIHSGYTARVSFTQRLAESRQQGMVASAGEALRKAFPPEAAIPEGPVAKILGEAKSAEETNYADIEVLCVVPQWHTPLTRLYLVKHERAVLWCPGGNIQEASRRLELRPDPGM